ncbi:MAG: tRNA pseudouridine(55) synthase TruB [Clostridiales bacterium]|nr:tRNA pseudouridine(55) synthase TruB [Clostridiales bacterium]
MNGILLIDKPSGWTSHDVVAKLRGILGERRIGHAGTLDPMATGLLVIFVGRATRAVQFAESQEKEYFAHFRFGIVTDTQDITGNILQSSDKTITKQELYAVLPEFTGEISQIPPMYSAVKLKGKKLYELARQGLEVEREKRTVTIKKLDLEAEREGDFLFRIVCSKGTYIRTLCHDIGQRLGVGGALSALRREKSGSFSVADAYTMEQISEHSQNGSLESCFLSVDSLFSEYKPLTLTEQQKRKCLCGNSFETSVPDGTYRAYADDGSFLMLALAKDGVMSTIKSFFEV